MIDESDPIIRTAERLCETLERIGDALVALDADALLETEETLEQLLATLGRRRRRCRTSRRWRRVVRRSIDALTGAADWAPRFRQLPEPGCGMRTGRRDIRPRRRLCAARRVRVGGKGEHISV